MAKKPAKKKRYSNGKGGPADYDGSTPLTDSRREAFVQNIISGRYPTRIDAFAAAGYARQTGNHTRAYKAPEVQTRLRWLQAQVQAKTITAAEEIAKRFNRLAAESVRKALDGLQHIDVKKLKPSDIRSLAEVSVSAAKMYELLEGRATDRTENVTRDKLDRLMDQMRTEIDERLASVPTVH
jgi:hypothetical protein